MGFQESSWGLGGRSIGCAVVTLKEIVSHAGKTSGGDDKSEVRTLKVALISPDDDDVGYIVIHSKILLPGRRRKPCCKGQSSLPSHQVHSAATVTPARNEGPKKIP